MAGVARPEHEADSLPERLYHYTNAQGLYGILTSTCLWATHVRFLNDRREFDFGRLALRTSLAELRLNVTHDDSVARIERLQKVADEMWKTHQPFFVASLSEAADSLSQWRAYCANGGFAIGLPRSELEDLARKQRVELRRCIYSERAQADKFRRLLLERFENWVQAEHPTTPREDFSMEHALEQHLAHVLPYMKHPSFSEEREWRLVTQPEWLLPDQQKRKGFRTRGPLVVPYAEIKLPESRDFWLKCEIVVGPTRFPDEAEEGVRLFTVDRFGSGLMTRQSETPFRDL